MNEFSITPFRGLHLLLLLLTAAAVLLIFLLLRGKPEARRSRFLIGVCFFNLALFAGYKLSLSMDAAYGNRHFWCRGYYGDHQRRSVNPNASCAALAAGASESLRFSSNSLLLPLRVHSLTITSALHPLLSGARSMPVYYLLAGKRFLHTVDFEKT